MGKMVGRPVRARGRWGIRLYRLRKRRARQIGRWPSRAEMAALLSTRALKVAARTYEAYESGARVPPAWLQERLAEVVREIPQR